MPAEQKRECAWTDVVALAERALEENHVDGKLRHASTIGAARDAVEHGYRQAVSDIGTEVTTLRAEHAKEVETLTAQRDHWRKESRGYQEDLSDARSELHDAALAALPAPGART